MPAKKGRPKPPGSGRKKGNGITKISVDVVKAWRDAGKPSPLQVMLNAMEEELRDEVNIGLGRQNRRAFPYATACAVYFHPKPLTQVSVSATDAGTTAREIWAAVRGMDTVTGGGQG